MVLTDSIELLFEFQRCFGPFDGTSSLEHVMKEYNVVFVWKLGSLVTGNSATPFAFILWNFKVSTSLFHK